MFFRKPNITIDEKTVDKAVKELQNGSAEAFHLLYQKYSHQIFRFCLRMLDDPSFAEDAFQETFIRVFEQRDKFKGEHFSSWLYSIARHTCLNYLRSKKDFETIDDDFQENDMNSDVDSGMQDYIRKAVAGLPVALREAVILREYEDCSYQDIADILGIDLSLAKVRVYRARLILRKILQPLVKEIYEH